MSRRTRLTDPALAFLYMQMKEENKGLPPGKRMGFRRYCRKYGILAPEHEQSIREYEITTPDASGMQHHEGE